MTSFTTAWDTTNVEHKWAQQAVYAKAMLRHKLVTPSSPLDLFETLGPKQALAKAIRFSLSTGRQQHRRWTMQRWKQLPPTQPRAESMPTAGRVAKARARVAKRPGISELLRSSLTQVCRGSANQWQATRRRRVQLTGQAVHRAHLRTRAFKGSVSSKQTNKQTSKQNPSSRPLAAETGVKLSPAEMHLAAV